MIFLLFLVLDRFDVCRSSDDDVEASVSVRLGANTKKSKKIIDSLSQMGLYIRGYHFSDLKQKEATVPTHVFSLSESALMGIHKSDPEGLFNHNKNFLMRAYPKGSRISSSNLDPSLFWRVGVQMVALNWQRMDKGMMLQHAMFHGTEGWVQKPEMLLSSAKYRNPKEASQIRSWLSLKILAAQELPLSTSVDRHEKLRPYVKCEVHVDMPSLSTEEKEKKRPKDIGLKKATSPSKGPHPTFGDGGKLVFEKLPALEPSLSFLRLKVMHDKFGPDETIAWACIRLDCLGKGIRFIHLSDPVGASISAVLLAQIDYAWNQHPRTIQSGR